MRRILIISTFLFWNTNLISQNHFEQFEFLIGKWQGVESGVAGNGVGFRTYEYDLNDNYMVEKNISTFPKTDKKPMGEVHRDFGIFSFNSNDSSIVFRQYHSEGFVNIYELDKGNSTSQRFIFITKEIENNPGNWKAKLILEKKSDAEFTETFEVAMDGKNFGEMLKNHWKKIK